MTFIDWCKREIHKGTLYGVGLFLVLLFTFAFSIGILLAVLQIRPAYILPIISVFFIVKAYLQYRKEK